MRHDKTGAHATVTFSSVPDPIAPAVVTSHTFGADGRTVRTYGGGEQSNLGQPAGTIVAPYAASLSLEWEAHCRAVTAAGVQSADIPDDDALARWNHAGNAHFDTLVRERALLPARDAAYVLSWRDALKATRRLLAAQRPLAAQRSWGARSEAPVAGAPSACGRDGRLRGQAEGPMDDDIAGLVLANLASESPQEHETTQEKLRERLGTASRRQVLSFGTSVTHNVSVVRVELQALGLTSVDTVVRPMLPWLGGRSCANATLSDVVRVRVP
jgi:hypothetical protein